MILAGWLGLLFTNACGETPAPEGWLTGELPEKFEKIARQLRGLDMTMVEVGYRFVELYFAGEDRNWPYARYQVEKMDLTLRLGLERRPQRAPSARPFLEEDLPAVLEAVEKEDLELFRQQMERLRSSCMTCHVLEDVPHFTVEFPQTRVSPMRGPAPNSP